MFSLLILVFSIFYHWSEVRAFNSNMAWRSSGASNRELIENLFRNGLIKDQRIKETMLHIDRADFTDHKSDAYEDRPQSSNYEKNYIFLIINLYFFLSSWLCGKFMCIYYKQSLDFISSQLILGNN
jgi:hypothetical protein